jgi:glutathionylspermidine synthase
MSLTQQLGIPFEYDVQNYANEEVINFADLELNLSLKDFEKISSELANIIDKTSLDVGYNSDLIKSLGYPESITDVPDGDLSAMRLSYVIDLSGKPHLIEVNSQTPSFWWECETGADKVLGLQNLARNPQYIENLKNCLINNIKLLETKLQKFLKPKIGLVTCDSPDDIFQMVFIKGLIDSLGITANTEVLTIDKVDIAISNRVFSLNTDEEFDILFFWYPIEWLINDKFADGSDASSKFFKLLKNKKVGFFNGIQSFVAQNKNLFGYITEMSNELHPNIIETYYTIEEFQTENARINWIGKPIFGREGRGIFGEVGEQNIAGDCNDDYYNNQLYIYQPFIDSKKISYFGKEYYYTLEKWMYKTNSGWVPGGHGLRLTEGKIVDNKSIWVVLN